MADRDLINKPVSLPMPEGQDSDKKHIKPQPLGKLGVRERAREVARETAALPELKSTAQPPPAAVPTGAGQGRGAQARSPAQAKQAPATPAFAAAYFNKDVEALSVANPRARPMAALRGEEGATDLRRVTLPNPSDEEVPAPEELGQTLALMGADEAQGAHEPKSPQMGALLRRQGQWAQAQGMTPQKLAARLAELEAKVQARRAALARLGQLTPAHLARAASVAQAFLRQGIEDDAGLSEEDGNALIEGVGQRAQGLHQRLRKMLRSRR